MAAAKGKGSTTGAKTAKPSKAAQAKEAAKAAVKTGKAAVAARAPAKATKTEATRNAKPEVVAMPARLSVAAALLRRNARRVGV
ncbi:MAG: hypothetical protein NZ523_08900 [Elioraea sp.]|nr:hypothetical protein [Elioraea sp.]MDW8444326.1 hypothetical protein [Acetobacteraceae bacterium]